MDRPGRNYGDDHAKALRHELLRIKVPRRPAPQRGTPIQGLAHRVGGADAHVCRYWHGYRGQKQYQALSRGTSRTPQAALEITFSCVGRCCTSQWLWSRKLFVSSPSPKSPLRGPFDRSRWHNIRGSSWDKDGFRFSAVLQAPLSARSVD